MFNDVQLARQEEKRKTSEVVHKFSEVENLSHVAGECGGEGND